MTVPRTGKATAFTLIELLIVVGLMVVMYAMLMSFGSEAHQRTQKEVCSGNLQKIFLALQIYSNDYAVYPRDTNAQTSEQVLNPLVPKYTVDTSLFICPGGRDPAIPAGAIPIAGRAIFCCPTGKSTRYQKIPMTRSFRLMEKGPAIIIINTGEIF